MTESPQKKQDAPPRKPDHVLMIVQAGVLWFVLNQMMYGANYHMVDRYKTMRKEEEYSLDMDHAMPPRAPYQTTPSNPWWYLAGSDTSM